MNSVFIRHRVADFDTWKAAFDEHGAQRREHGLADTSLLRDDDDDSMVTIVMNTDDAARAREFLSSDDLRETMEKAGVVSQPDVWIAHDA
jgi:hypothetical protein